jgi:hypothetical protein
MNFSKISEAFGDFFGTERTPPSRGKISEKT